MRLLLGHYHPEDVLVVDHADESVTVHHAARTLVVEHDPGSVADDLVTSTISVSVRCKGWYVLG